MAAGMVPLWPRWAPVPLPCGVAHSASPAMFKLLQPCLAPEALPFPSPQAGGLPVLQLVASVQCTTAHWTPEPYASICPCPRQHCQHCHHLPGPSSPGTPTAADRSSLRLLESPPHREFTNSSPPCMFRNSAVHAVCLSLRCSCFAAAIDSGGAQLCSMLSQIAAIGPLESSP